MNRKKTLLNEVTLRRWGKLANMAPLTETWLEEQDDENSDVAAAAEDEIAAGEAEIEAGEEAEASTEEQEAVENIVMAVVDAIAQETGVEIEVEGGSDDEAAMDDMDAGMDASDELDDAADDEMDAADDAAMRDRGPGGRDRYNRTDEGTKKGDDKKGSKDKAYVADKDQDEDEDGHRTGEKAFTTKKGMKKKTGPGKAYEALDIDVIDDEHLTEAVLKRVVERLLKRQ